jgi:hypothetical protein
MQYNITPVKKFVMPVNKEAVMKSGLVKPGEIIANEIKIDLSKKTYLLRSDLLMLSLIANGDWNRPICFTSLSGPQDLGIEKYVRQEGMTYRFVPFESKTDEIQIDYELAYNNMMNKAVFQGAGKKGIYYDEENRRRLNLMRLAYAQAAIQFVNNGEKEKARNLLHHIDDACDEHDFPYGMTSSRGNSHDAIASRFLYACVAADDAALAKKVAISLKTDLVQQISYYNSLGDEPRNMDQLAGAAYQHLQNGSDVLNARQAAFANDILSSYQLLKQIDSWQKKM